ncbi:MAG: hypothetical protein NTZ55_05320 [Candidatus Roizmanbacteria bacterium]|nr:hypothetical protein [Candidatus Roizmanbacteria bacterium]
MSKHSMEVEYQQLLNDEALDDLFEYLFKEVEKNQHGDKALLIINQNYERT